MRKNTRANIIGLLCGAIGLVMFSAIALATAGEEVKHPELTEQEMLISCNECHKQETPELEKQWYDSLHGLAMVKCYQCHGTFESFVVTPTRENCGTCHTDMLAKDPKDKPCWECHIPHSFKTEK